MLSNFVALIISDFLDYIIIKDLLVNLLKFISKIALNRREL
jgi:hypothetical protein